MFEAITLRELISALGLMGGILAYFKAGSKEASERKKEQALHQAKVERDISELETGLSTVSSEVHSLNERVTDGFLKIHTSVGRLEGKIDAWDGKLNRGDKT